MLTAENKQRKKVEIMEKCFARFCETGLRDTGIKDLAKACGMTAPNFYSYFDNLDQLIVECTAHCIRKIEDEFYENAPKSKEDIFPYIEKMIDPDNNSHAKEYRFMHQVYTSPAFLEYGKKYKSEQYARFRKEAEELAPVLNVSWYLILSWIICFEETLVEYALFENSTRLIIQKVLLKNMAESMLANNEIYTLNADLAKIDS